MGQSGGGIAVQVAPRLWAQSEVAKSLFAIMSQKCDFASKVRIPPLLCDGELARAALLLEGDGKDPGGPAAADMGPRVEDDGRERPKEALRAPPSFNVVQCSATQRRVVTPKIK